MLYSTFVSKLFISKDFHIYALACWVTSQAFIWLQPIKPFKYTVKENKHQAPESENTDNNIFRIP